MKRKRSLISAFLSVATLLAVGFMPPTVEAASPAVEEEWFVMLNGEDRIGYLHSTEATAPNGDITSTETVKIVMARAGTRIEIAVGSEFVETADGEPIRASSSLNMGGVPIVTEVEFGEKAMKVTSGQAGRTTTKMQRPIEGDWLPPAAMARYVEEQLAAGAEQITTRTLDVTSGLKPIEMTMRVQGREDVEVYGKVVPAIAWDATVSAMPGITLREYVDEEGNSIKSTIALMPGMELTVLKADKVLALSELTPAEMMAQTFVVPSRPIENPRELTGAVYRLKTKDGRPLTDLPLVGQQQVLSDGRSAVAAVGMIEEPLVVIDTERYLTASAVLNHEDPAVKKWLEPLASMSFVTPAAEPIAEWLRQTVYEKIDSKDLSVGFATASDVARTKQGDCSEHAVLLAALLRGAGIPSRCVSGLIYADQFAGHEGIFGYHMWTQAWIADADDPTKGRWVDFDATLPGGVRSDATHIALSVSDMNDGLIGNDMAALLPLLGNLEIEVVETTYDDTP
ncbi:MAG: transglutaminase-like domain-containing protein [Planctomycetota bacterium]